MNLPTFTKAFVAGLVTRDRLGVYPHSPADRRGFANVVKVLDTKVNELKNSGAKPQEIRQLVRVTNELRASTTGGFEGFEAALRALQLTFSACPNPDYEEITFSVPKPYAEATLSDLSAPQRQLVSEAVAAFVREADA